MFNEQSDLHIVIDTDPGTDDSLALAIGSVYFKNKISAIISSYGNVDGVQTYHNLINLVNLLSINSVLLQGSLNPLNNKDVAYTNYHGNNGLCGIDLPSTKYVKKNNDAIESLYNIIRNKIRVKYVSLAPLTNFAKLLEYHPDVVEYIDELIIMGGGFHVYNVSNSAEYNFSLDGLAVQNVLKSSVKKILCPLDMTYQLAFTLEEIESIIGCDREYVFKSTSPYSLIAQIFFKNYDTAILHNCSGAIIHDATTLMYLLAPDKCRLARKRIKANDFGSISETADGYCLDVIQSIDKNYVASLLRDVFNQLER